MNMTLVECPGCRVAPGEAHGEADGGLCRHAACPDCGEHLSMHTCERRPKGTDGPDRPALWHGVDQRAEVARKLNWWTTITDRDEPVEDYDRVLFALALGQITWNPETQKYAIGEIDEAALDRAMKTSWR